ncbi:MAG: hypothetical protein OXN81_14505 [Alphaproteobacteria bacterium]|nr:hypothetical protein [Alphaproteobacteria bacterium]
MTAKQAPRANATEDVSAGPLFAAAEAEETGSDAATPASTPEPGAGAAVRDSGAEGGAEEVPPAGDGEDTEAGEEAPDDPRRLNRNMEQMLETMDGLVDVLLKTQARLEAAGGEGGKTADGGDAAPAADGVPVHAADFYRWIETDRRRQRRWSRLALAAAAPAALLLGLLVQQQFQLIPLHDPTGGWRGHVWEQYGRTIVDCAAEAMRTDAEIDCPLVVRRP